LAQIQTKHLLHRQKKDFIAKMAISSKKAKKTHYWLSLLQKSQLVPLDYNRYILHRTS
jgi:hypothetical protein